MTTHYSAPDIKRKQAAALGLAAVGLFVGGLVVFTILTPTFNPLHDYISQLGAVGQPLALWWNLLGFGAVGLLLAGFGWTFGQLLQDRLLSVLLALFGLGFAAAGVPIDLGDETAPVSKAHVVAVCLGLAAWLFGLARMTHLTSLGKMVHRAANIAAVLLVLSAVGQVLQLWAMPVTHRLVLLVVFGWTGFSSLRLLRGE